MRFLLTSDVLFLTVVVTSAIYKPGFKPKNLAKLFDPKRYVIENAHHLQKRQSQGCINAYLEAQSPQFQQCSQLFADADDVTVDEIVEFCDSSDNCVSVVARVLTDLENCEGNDDNTTVSIIIGDN